MKKLTILLFTLVVSIFITGCQKDTQGDQYNRIIDRGYIIVGLDDTFVPMGFRNAENEIIGFDVDLAKLIFEEMGLDVRFQPIDWSMKETELNNGRIDVIWNGYSITEERKEKVTFSDPYLENRQVIIVPQTSTIQSKEDLANKNVGVQASSSSYDALVSDQTLVSTINNGKPSEYPTNDFAFQDLMNGRIDALIIDEVFGEYYIKSNGLSQLKVIDQDLGTEQYGVGFRQDDLQLIKVFNETFNALKENGEAGKISARWFNDDLILYSSED